MKSASSRQQLRPLRGLDRSALEQASVNLKEALRGLELLPYAHTELVPHPLIVARSEIENARRYLRLLEPHLHAA